MYIYIYVAHHLGDDAVLPLARLHVHEAVELVRADGLIIFTVLQDLLYYNIIHYNMSHIVI